MLEKDRGEAGRGLPRDEGREPGGDSRIRVGSLGEDVRGKGEVGLDEVRGALAESMSTGAGLAFLLLPWMEEEDDLGDCM